MKNTYNDFAIFAIVDKVNSLSRNEFAIELYIILYYIWSTNSYGRSFD